MTLLLTVFGGLVLTVALFALARAFRLSAYWAALLGAGVPSLAYLSYASMVWPGLDVVTLHVIAYPTVALLLYQMYGRKSAGSGRMHWAPKLLVAFFVLITVLFGGFVHIASEGLPPSLATYLLPGAATHKVHTGFAGVVAHSPRAAKVIGHRQLMEHKLDRLGWHVEVAGLDALAPGREGAVRVEIRDRDRRPVSDARVNLELGRPGQPPQSSHALRETETGSYRASLALDDGGAWLATLTLGDADEHIVLEHVLGKE